MKKKNFLIALVGVLLMTMVLTAQAPPPIQPILNVTRVVVKPDRIAEWMDVEKLYNEAYKKGGGLWRRIYRSRSGNIYEFVVLTPITSYADLDGESFITKGASAEDRARWGARRSQCIESAVTTYERVVPDAFINEPGASLPTLLSETRYRVKPGMGAQFRAFIKSDTIPALKKAGTGLFVLRKVDFGGSSNMYVSRRGFSKYADLDVNVITKGLGAEGATKYFEKLNPMLNDVEVRIYEYQPAISYSGQ